MNTLSAEKRSPQHASVYTPLQAPGASFLLLLIVSLVLVVVGGYCAWVMEHQGHVITGMNNRVVWGLPHTFAIALILAASGALNGATLSSVFKQRDYAITSRLSVALAVSLLIGGLVVLVLDLGRPDRLIVAMTTYNFRSIFAWNIFLYSGFVVLGLIYLWFLLEKRLYGHSRKIGIAVLVWRIALTTGTGSIFGFLVGRDALDTALLAPLFIALSFAIGTAVLSLILLMLGYFKNQSDSEQPLLQQVGLLLRYCLLGLAYFSIVHHLTNLYVAEHHTTERWFLLGGFSRWFWLGHVGLGVLLPLILLMGTQKLTRARLCWSALLTVVGSWALVYTIVIGSQSLPQRIFPDKVVIESSFGDAAVVHYQASIWEWGLGFGGVALGLLILAGLLRIFPLTPASTGSR